VPGTVIEIDLTLPDGSVSHLKGRVKRAEKTRLNISKNGMGVELISVDENFRRFFTLEFNETIAHQSVSTATGGAAPSRSATPEIDPSLTVIVTCHTCSARNRVIKSKLHLGPKCGKCGSPLQA